jgi:hypothetical protein
MHKIIILSLNYFKFNENKTRTEKLFIKKYLKIN